jgi:ABC-type nitrate/sulfonate/bicarbonate transport system ATPase subunit
VSVDLVVDGVEKTFAGVGDGGRRLILGGVSFAAPAGSIVCVLGPSGCGKTTLLRIIAGLEAPDRGRVVVGERAVAGPLREIGYITQEATLLPWRTVRHNVELGLEIAGVPPEERRTVARRHLELVELAGFDDYFPKQISGGMKQKVALARSLAVGPRVLLLDEPFAALDAQTRNSLQEVLLHVQACTHTTMVFVTHNVDEAVFLGDAVVCLTAHPARVGKSVAVSVPHPRDRTGTELNALRKELLAFLAEERQRARAAAEAPARETGCGPEASQRRRESGG